MATRPKRRPQRGGARTTQQSSRDTAGIGTLMMIFGNHGTVDPSLRIRDTTPNVDGGLTVIDSKGIQTGLLMAQVKTTTIKDVPFKYTFNDEGTFFEYCAREKENAVVLICIDPIKKLGYWRDMTPEYVKSLHRKKTVAFPEDQIISEERREYHAAWTTICALRIKAIENQKEQQKKNAGVPVRAAVVRSSVAAARANAAAIRAKLQTILIDNDVKYKFYFPLLSLIDPFYINERSTEQRAKLRSILSITEEEEQRFMQQMIEDKLIKIVGNLCVVTDEEKSKTLLSEIIDRGTIPIEALAQLFN